MIVEKRESPRIPFLTNIILTGLSKSGKCFKSYELKVDVDVNMNTLGGICYFDKNLVQLLQKDRKDKKDSKDKMDLLDTLPTEGIYFSFKLLSKDSSYLQPVELCAQVLKSYYHGIDKIAVIFSFFGKEKKQQAIVQTFMIKKKKIDPSLFEIPILYIPVLLLGLSHSGTDYKTFELKMNVGIRFDGIFNFIFFPGRLITDLPGINTSFSFKLLNEFGENLDHIGLLEGNVIKSPHKEMIGNRMEDGILFEFSKLNLRQKIAIQKFLCESGMIIPQLPN